MKQLIQLTLAPLISIIALIRPAYADPNWGQWQSDAATEVSVSFLYLPSADTWTWRFRNDGISDITSIYFTYEDKDGLHSDIMPIRLKPGAWFGGWSSFTASSSPRITLTKVNRASIGGYGN